MVKAFVGDMYLCNHALLTEIPENVRNNSLTYMESDCFGTEELAFIGSLGFFGTNTLVYKTQRLESNDDLLALLESGTDNNLYIITEQLVKGRKLYNKLSAMKCIAEFDVDFKTFQALLRGRTQDKLSLSDIEYIAKRCGFHDKDVTISARDIISWGERLMTVGVCREHIDEIVPKYTPDNVFLLKDCLMKRQSGTVMEIADSILKAKGSAIGALSAVLIDVRILLKLSYFKGDKVLTDRAVKAMGIGSRRVNNYNYSTEQLSKCYDRLCRAIINLKSGYMTDVEFKNALSDCLLYLS